jgi:YrbI family 3-deoxy-D-manno-octulosonate 8-phosphate phosphatase
MDDVLALVPARGGSKGLPRKNLRLLQGHPLIAYAIAAGLQAQNVMRTVCSTDDAEIAEIAKRYGAEVPFMRPPELAEDLTPDLPVFQHVLHWFARHESWQPAIVVHLRPTSPIRFPGEVDEAIEVLQAHPAATAIRSVCPAPCNPYKMWQLPKNPECSPPFMTDLLNVPGISEPYNHPRQELPPVWWQTGAVDAVRPRVILAGSMTGDRVLPLRTDSRYAIDIDSELGLRMAEVVMDGLNCIRPASTLDWGHIRLLVLDVDGTLTPGTMYYSPDGEALKRFHTHDGHGIGMVRELGVQAAIVTSENTAIAPARARKLGISHVYIGVQDKLTLLKELCTHLGTTLREVAYVGDDVADVPPMCALASAGGIPCAVADARPEVKSVARYICPSRGGYGAVRDVCDLICTAKRAS